MRINKKLFPYPILNRDSSKSTYINSSFAFECENIIQNDQYCVLKNIHYLLDNETIVNLIENELVKVYCVVECSSSVYRNQFEIKNIPIDIEIPIHNLKENVVVSAFAIVTNVIEDYKDTDFISEYSEYSFTLERNDIIAADDGFSFKIDYEEESDNKISSIFKVIKQSDDDLLLKVSPSSRKIFIYVPEEQFNHYDNLKNNETVKAIFFSILIIPALMISIEQIKKLLSDDKVLEDLIVEFTWLKSIIKRFKEVFGRELNEEEFKELNSLEISQALVEYPIVSGINSIYNMSFKNTGDEIDD